MGTISRTRLRAVLALRDMQLSEFAHRVGVSQVHLTKVLSGRERLTEALRDKIGAELGAMWPFVIGEDNTLTVEAAA